MLSNSDIHHGRLKDGLWLVSKFKSTIEQDYNLNASTVERFLREMCVVTKNREDFIICRDLWDTYFKFCKNNALNWKSDNVFGMELGQQQVRKERLRINRVDREYCYLGIKLKEDNSR